MVKALQNDIEFNAEGIRLLDRHRVVLQRWTNYLFNRINRLDGGKRLEVFFVSSVVTPYLMRNYK